MLAGGAIAWLVAIPIYSTFFLAADPVLSVELAGASAEDAAYAIWSSQIRYLGVGAMLVGGVWTLVSLRKSLVSGIRSGLTAGDGLSGSAVPATERDLPMRYILIGTALFTLPLLILYQAIVEQWMVSIPMTVIMITAGFLFVSVSAYMAGLVGSSNNPVSGLTIATILFAALVLAALLGRSSPIGAVATIMIGAVVCCAACIGGDNLQDLKCGYILGATPWKQQLMLAVGGVSSAFIMAPVLSLLAQAYGIGVPTETHPNPLLAPQANLMASVAKGIFGGELPWTMIGIGAAVGWPVRSGSICRSSSAYRYSRGASSPISSSANSRRETAKATASASTRKVRCSPQAVAVGSADVLALPDSLHFDGWLGLIFLAAVGIILYRIAVKQSG
jgi:putative OPT family oligopeptide transporter